MTITAVADDDGENERHININVTGADPDAVIDALKRYERSRSSTFTRSLKMIVDADTTGAVAEFHKISAEAARHVPTDLVRLAMEWANVNPADPVAIKFREALGALTETVESWRQIREAFE